MGRQQFHAKFEVWKEAPRGATLFFIGKEQAPRIGVPAPYLPETTWFGFVWGRLLARQNPFSDAYSLIVGSFARWVRLAKSRLFHSGCFGQVHGERRRHGFAQAPPMPPLQLVHGPVQLSFQFRFHRFSQLGVMGTRDGRWLRRLGIGRASGGGCRAEATGDEPCPPHCSHWRRNAFDGGFYASPRPG